MTGHCSKCGKIWTLDTASGKCQWCGKQATCQTNTTTRPIKSSRQSKARQPNIKSDGYDQLPGPYFTFYKVASHFAYKVLADDQQDVLHDIIVTLADVARHKLLTEPAMYRVASITIANYWRAHYKLTNGLDCGSCSKVQRRKCKEDDLYSECPKAIKLEYLSKPIVDSEGNITELGELIADDKAIDLDDWLDAKAFELSCPTRLIEIAHKKLDGIPLDRKERTYLNHYQTRQLKKYQKTLF